MMFKTRIRRFLTIAGIALVTIICISCCSMLRRQAIEGAWSDPIVSLSDLKHEWDATESHILIQCAYQLSQTARLRHPRSVWKNTDWERNITERVNVISTGVLVATIASDRANDIRPLPFTTMADQMVCLPSISGWALSFPKSISVVSSANTRTVYSVPASATISKLSMSDIETNVIFCSTQGWKTECVRLNVDRLASEVQYTFDASGVHGMRITSDDIVYLDTDPQHTVFITERGTRPQTGTLAVGIDTQNNTPISVLHPKDIAADAQGYEWMLSPNKKSLGLRIQHKGNNPESLWVTKTGAPPDFHPVGKDEWNKIMVRPNENELPSSITAAIKAHINKLLPEQLDRNNYYPPSTR